VLVVLIPELVVNIVILLSFDPQYRKYYYLWSKIIAQKQMYLDVFQYVDSLILGQVLWIGGSNIILTAGYK
jgi:hypothetical protein